MKRYTGMLSEAQAHIHGQAMNLVDEAHIAKMRGAYERWLKLTTQALALESEAAWAMAGELDVEPTRSVLFRSAASLALEIQNAREAERLISAALAGTPPEEIAEELRDLLENVYFSRHIERLTAEVDQAKEEIKRLEQEIKALRGNIPAYEPKPCGCIKQMEKQYIINCQCDNEGQLSDVVRWCERAKIADSFMSTTLHRVTINNIADLEAACRRWRELGATDDTFVLMQGNFILYVTGSLREHHTIGKLSIDFDYFDEA